MSTPKAKISTEKKKDKFKESARATQAFDPLHDEDQKHINQTIPQVDCNESQD